MYANDKFANSMCAKEHRPIFLTPDLSSHYFSFDDKIFSEFAMDNTIETIITLNCLGVKLGRKE